MLTREEIFVIYEAGPEDKPIEDSDEELPIPQHKNNYVRAELALKLEGFFKKKALDNQRLAAERTNENINKLKESLCQNSDNPVNDIKENSMIDNQEYEDIEEELPIPRSENIYERAEEALKLKEKEKNWYNRGIDQQKREMKKRREMENALPYSHSETKAAEEMNTQKRQNIKETFCQNSDKTISPNIDKLENKPIEDIEEELPG